MRRLLTLLLTALILSQNLVCCCGHSHAQTGETARSHVHLSGHTHGHGDHKHDHHHPHSHSHPTANPSGESPHNTHDFVLETIQHAAILQNPEFLPNHFKLSHSAPVLIHLRRSLTSDDFRRILFSKSYYWLESTTIHLQVRALLL